MSKVFVFDTAQCSGCYNCQVVCKDEHCNNDWLPYAKPQPDAGQFWIKIDEHIRGTVPKVKVSYVANLCMHCDNAPCIDACSEEAIYKRNDGLVIIDPMKCVGSQLCLAACPYGVIYFNQDLKISQKCTGCAHLLDRSGWKYGPRCTDACVNEALRFGEEVEFSAELGGSEVMKPELGLSPRVHYLNLPRRFIAGTVYEPNTKEVVIGATCTISGDGTGTVTTDGFGDFWFEGLEQGNFTLTIEADGKTKTISDISTEKDVNLGNIALS